MTTERSFAPTLIGLTAFVFSGCDPNSHFSPGTRVILADPSGNAATLRGMEEHTRKSSNPGEQAYNHSRGPVTSEGIGAGTRAVVVSDSDGGDHLRPVRLRLIAGPYRGLTGMADRQCVKAE